MTAPHDTREGTARGTYRVSVTATVLVEVGNEEAITRCGTPEWQAQMYRLPSLEAVLGHYAFNAVAHGFVDACQLDGWADLREDEVTMRVEHVQMEDVEKLPARRPRDVGQMLADAFGDDEAVS